MFILWQLWNYKACHIYWYRQAQPSYWQLSRSALVFYCFFIFVGVPVPLACSPVGHKHNLFANSKKKKRVGHKERKGAPKGCKIVQHEPCDACCFQSAVCQLEAQRESERKRKDNAEK